MSSKVAFYTGPGTSSICLDSMTSCLQKHMNENVHTISHFDSLYDLLMYPTATKAAIFVGGYAPSMSVHHSSYPPELKKYFKTTLSKHNISCLGSCAGTINLSTTLWARPMRNGNCTDPSTSTTLHYFPGTVVLPLFPLDRENEITNFRIVPLYSTCLNKNVSIPHSYGCGILDAHTHSGTEILSTFSEPPEVILQHSPVHLEEVGAARLCDSVFYKTDTTPACLLLSTHFECTSSVIASERFYQDFANITRGQQSKLVEQMKPNDADCDELAKIFFEKLGISCKTT